MNIKKPISYFFLTLLIISNIGCATILTGSRQKIEFTSNPKGAKVFVDGEQKIVTPGHIKVKKGSMHNITMRAEGYRNFNAILSNTRQHWTVWLNLVTYYTGWLIDAATGSSQIFTEDYINGTLIKKPEYVISSLPISVDKVILKLDDNELGKKLRRGKVKGGIFAQDITLNTKKLETLILKELEEVGFNYLKDSALKVQATISKIEHQVNEGKKNQYLSTSSVTVNWKIILNDKEKYSSTTKGSAVWPAIGNNSIELAYRDALYEFLLDNRLYEICEAKR